MFTCLNKSKSVLLMLSTSCRFSFRCRLVKEIDPSASTRPATYAACVEVSWLRGDMRELRFDGGFDAVINLFTAFGYFEDPEDDLKTLEGVRRALEPGGQFLLETIHRDALVVRYQPRIADKTPNGTVVLHEYDWDLARNVIDDRVTLIEPDGTRRHYTTSVRPRSLHELLALLGRAGLEPTVWHGGLGGSPLGLQSRRLALISRRPV